MCLRKFLTHLNQSNFRGFFLKEDLYSISPIESETNSDKKLQKQQILHQFKSKIKFKIKRNRFILFSGQNGTKQTSEKTGLDSKLFEKHSSISIRKKEKEKP